MTSRNEILAELAEIGSDLGTIPHAMPYHAPEGFGRGRDRDPFTAFGLSEKRIAAFGAPRLF